MKQATGIIFIASRIRPGFFPKLKGFTWSEPHGLYIYGGKELTVDEFNESCQVLFGPAAKPCAYALSCRIIEHEVEEPAPESPKPQQEPAPRALTVPSSDPSLTDLLGPQPQQAATTTPPRSGKGASKP